MKWLDHDDHSRHLREMLASLGNQPMHQYLHLTPSAIPESPGIYIIAAGWEVIRAGKTTNLQQRIYRNHLMGNQSGNLRAQLVRSGQCKDLAEAKKWIRTECRVQFLEIPDEKERSQVEHFMLAMVKPRFCDNNREV